MNYLPTQNSLRANWFFVAAAAVLATDLTVLNIPHGASPRLLEAGLLGDLALLIPCLYLACYWRKGKRAVIRTLALASLGFWFASKLLPASGHFIISSLSPLRYVALAVLFAIEVKVVLVTYKAVFSGATRREAEASLQQQTDLPVWVAKLMTAEAMFWRAAWAKVKAHFRK